MISNYVSKVEDKFVFNFSLIFWHLLVLVASAGILFGLAVFAWSMLPASQRQVTQPSVPEKRAYPAPVKVDLNELKFEDAVVNAPAVEVALEPVPEAMQGSTPTAPVPDPAIDETGKDEFEAAMHTLRSLIPPTRHPWEGDGYWNYPYGERYWDVYRQEKYRQWIETEPGVEGKLARLFTRSKAQDYAAKRELISTLNTLLSKIPETERYATFLQLIQPSSDNWQHHVAIYSALSALPAKINAHPDQDHVIKLARFGLSDPANGKDLIDHVVSIIDRFHVESRVAAIDVVTNSYYNYFNRDLGMQQEATGLYLEMLDRIDPKDQARGLMQYYGLYLTKNQQRGEQMARMDREHQALLQQIEAQHNAAQVAAMVEHQNRKQLKSTFRTRSLIAVGGGVLLIVVVATMLVFLSIQRIVRKIEAKLPSPVASHP